MHSYDLLLQPPVLGAPLALDQALAALAERGLERRGEESVVRLQAGAFSIRPLCEGAVPRALELRVPLGDRADLLESAIAWAVEAAAGAGLTVVDPQLGVVLTGPSGASTEAFIRAARYAGEYAGISEAVGLSSLAEPPRSSTLGARMLLAVAVFLLVVWGTFRAAEAFRSRRSPAPPAAAPRSP